MGTMIALNSFGFFISEIIIIIVKDYNPQIMIFITMGLIILNNTVCTNILLKAF